MNELTPYEKQLAEQSGDLPLPDKASAWEKMKELLDNDDDKGGGIPINSAGNNTANKFLWALLILLTLMCICWFFIKVKKKETQLSKNNKEEIVTPGQALRRDTKREIQVNREDTIVLNSRSKQSKDQNNIEPQNRRIQSANDGIKIKKIIGNSDNDIAVSKIIKGANKKDKSIVNNYEGKTHSVIKGAEIGEDYKPGISKDKTSKIKGQQFSKETFLVNKKINSKEKKSVSELGKLNAKVTPSQLDEENEPGKAITEIEDTNAVKDTVVSIQDKQYLLPIDTLIKKDTAIVKDTAVKKDSLNIVKEKTTSVAKRIHHLSVGLTLQQIIRTNRTSVYPEENYTNKTLVTDYLPSVFIRFYHKNWFVHTEFKYAAPVYISDFMYSSGIQNQPYNFIASTRILKKVNYHRVQLMIDHFVLPHWSVGLGMNYNIYGSQVSHAEVNKKLYGLNDSLISSNIIRDKRKDFNFLNLKNYLQVVGETQYKWKQMSLGVSYAVAIQNYVDYIDPYTSKPAKRKSNTLNVFIRREFGKLKK